MNRRSATVMLAVFATVGSIAAAPASAATHLPVITSLTASKSALPAGGGSLTVHATTTHSTSCSWSIAPAIKGFAKTVKCAPAKHHSAKSISRNVKVPANLKIKSVKYTVTLTAHAHGHVVRRVTHLTVKPAAPEIPVFSTYSPNVPSTGDTVYFRYQTHNATVCKISLKSGSPSVAGLPETDNCSVGSPTNMFTPPDHKTYEGRPKFALPANPTTSAKTYTFVLAATGPGGTATSTVVVTVAKPPVSPLSWSVKKVNSANSALDTVSCTNPNFCIAMEDGGQAVVDKSGTWGPLTEVFGSNSDPVVSCATLTICVAIDNSGNFSRYDGSSWSTSASLDTNNTESVSCVPNASSAFCVVLDDLGDVVTGNGTTWASPVNVIDPGGNAVVSCGSPTFCMIVNEDGGYARYTSTGWHSEGTVDQTATTTHDGPITLSCTSNAFCMAVTQRGTAFAFASGKWAASPLTDTAGQAAMFPSYALSCATSAFCMEVDAADHVGYFNGTKWTDGGVIDQWLMNSISCPSTSFCMAIDSQENSVIGIT